ncbi:MAG: efflux RND transporter permease subunit [Capsulimonadaceae bacterium]|nr:efflux RND transporter permease subunit [Capsulimonadaceae bacterium]
MNLPQLSVTHPVTVSMRILGFVLLGIVCLGRLPVDLLPNVSIPTVAIITQWPNVSPEDIEAQVTRPIEEAVSAVPNMYTVTSDTVEGTSTVRVQFQWGTDIGQGAVDVLQLVERARQKFPTDPTLQEPIVFKYDPSQLPILQYGVTGISDPVKLRTLLDNEITPIIESADGVASAVSTGGLQRAILVNADPDRLRAYGLSLDNLVARIAQENQNVPAGIALKSKTELTIRSLGWFINPQQIARVPLKSVNGRLISVGDVAAIEDSHTDTRVWTRMNGAPAVGIIISKQSGVNTVSTAEAVATKIAQITKRYPYLHFEVAYDQAEFIDDSIKDLQSNAIFGGCLAVVVLLFFLRNYRSTVVVALSIPISITSTFAVIYLCGFTLNTMSLGGLALATGLIADDAVVVLENIYRHMERGKGKVRAPEAAVSGGAEMMQAVLASTLTVMVVFLPLLLIKGQAGEMFTQFALVVIFSIAMSWLDATTVVPMIASRFIKPEDTHENPNMFGYRVFRKFGQWFDALDESYRHGLRWALKHRLTVVSFAAGITALSLLLAPQIGVELMPATDSGDFQINLKLPPGTALGQTRSVMLHIEQVVLANKNVKTAFTAIGSQLGLRGTSTTLYGNQGAIVIKLKDRRPDSTLKVMADLRKQLRGIPGARIQVVSTDVVTRILTGGNTAVEVDIFGSNLDTLSKLGAQVLERTKGIPGFVDADTNWQEAAPEVQWHVDREKAVQMGVTFSDVANTLNTATNGYVSSYYQENGFQYPIQVQYPLDRRLTESQLASVPITPSLAPAGTTSTVMLQQVATPSIGVGPSDITRLDRQRYIAVSGQPQGRSEGEIQKDVAKALNGMDLPQGYYWDWGLNQKQRDDQFGSMGASIFLAIALIYMLLAAQFESFTHPLTILCSVPVSIVGVLLGLFLCGRSFGLTALIGILMLVGIVVKNGILLVDYTNTLRGRGMERNAAVMEAAPTRLRPILMTTSATVLGMMPIAMAIGKGSETNAPMATAVIGGLLTSTLLTLFVVPTVYTLFDDLGRRFSTNEGDLAQPALVEPTPAGVGDE